MGMDLTVYQADPEHGYTRTFTFSQKQIDVLLSKGVNIKNKVQNWIETDSFTDFDVDCLFGFNIKEANKLITQPGCRYYYTELAQDEQTVNGKLFISLVSLEVEGFWEDFLPKNSTGNLCYKEDSKLVHKTIKLPESFYRYLDSYDCTILVDEIAYQRKPFRHESTESKQEDGKVVIYIDNWTGLGEKAYEVLNKYAEEHTSWSSPSFISTDIGILTELASYSNDPTFWNEKILNPLRNNSNIIVNIDW